jgi:hypothetical protein
MLLGLRVRRAYLQTAVRTLYRRQDGRTITLVGTCHIGERVYFDKLAEHICFLEDKGALVYCEAAHAATPDPDAPELTAEQQAVQHLLTVADELTTRRITELLGWTRQKQVLTRETWVTPDMSMDDIQRESDGDQMRQFAEGSLKNLYWPEGDPIAPLRWHVQTTDFLRLTATNLQSAQRRINAGLPPVVVERRRQVVIDNALAVVGQGRDLVIVWGAGHQPAMLDDLAAHGFRRTGPVTWHTVGELPTMWQRLTYVRRIRAARKTGLQQDTGPDDTAGITTPAPGWVEEMKEPGPAPQAVDQSATTGGNPKEAGRRR